MWLAILLAHQGGWDEILFVAAPIVIFFGLLFLANRRANELHRQADEADETDLESEEA
ncbi:MAG: hypothetical protein HKN26_16250 [Acidimicrobiales bacterium]|nr:hypothetical protein [Acidimicrobiales bacterium]